MNALKAIAMVVVPLAAMFLFVGFLIAGADREEAAKEQLIQQRIDLAVLKATNELRAEHIKEIEEYNKLCERMMKVIEGRR